jgi:adenine specific DNA methylase Mod
LATTVYTSEEVQLLDGKTKVVLRPNSIAVQRKFMRLFQTPMENDDDATEADIVDKTYDRMIELTQICLSGLNKELSEDLEKIEELFDEQTIYKVIEICGGIELNSPKIQAALENLTDDLGRN